MQLKITKLKNDIILIKPDFPIHRTKDIIDELKSFISNDKCKNFILDLTDFNLLDCIRVGTLAATYHFVELMCGKMYIVVNNREAQRSIEIFNLSNTIVIYNQDRLVLENIA